MFGYFYKNQKIHLNKYGHVVEEQWLWPGRSLNMVESTPIHGQLLVLV